MSVQVHIVDGPLSLASLWAAEGAGALITFEGVVRGTEDGRALVALDYQVYEPMASKQLHALCRELIDRHQILAMEVTHSRGRVGVAQCSFRLRVASQHRKQGLAAMDEFIDRMKKDVPIWKTCVYPEDGR